MWLGATTLGSADVKALTTVPGTVFAAVLRTPRGTVTQTRFLGSRILPRGACRGLLSLRAPGVTPAFYSTCRYPHHCPVPLYVFTAVIAI